MLSSEFFVKLKKNLIRLLLIGAVFFLFLVIYLDSKVKHEFSQQAWEIPAKLYARPLSLSLGDPLVFSDLVTELKLLGYREKIKATTSGEYEVYQQTLVIKTRAFQFWDGWQKSQLIQLTIQHSKITALIDFTTHHPINFVRLDPLSLGNINIDPKGETQERVLVSLHQLPADFIGALLVSEDRGFYDHWGISIKGIVRALWTDVAQGQMVQGGSTLTQQLMKNHFLSNERSLWRKSQEAIMAILTEYHYDKQTILQAYINEVYLGQNRNIAIHGFAKASEFYFDRKISQLNTAQVALLVGMVKGPSYYNPRKHPKRALVRRNLVLKQMLEQGLLDQTTYRTTKSKTLMVVDKPPITTSRVPAFKGLVKRELAKQYSNKALGRDGLKLFTSLDPILQQKAEKSLSERLNKLDKNKQLQGALIVTDIDSGEIQAVVGDRQANYVGFNRAIDAFRQTGSVIKPAVYLTALASPAQFNLATPIKDKRFSLKGSDGSDWSPENYDRKQHGDSDGNIPLGDGLIHSYNLATAQLAMQVGIDNIVNTIATLGFERKIVAYPSIALGSKEMSPLEVTRLYQVIANHGVSVSPTALIAVQDQNGKLLNRYSKENQRVISPEASFLIRFLLTEVTREGTAKSLSWKFPNTQLAGKTGTTNDLRDSWYAGFDENKLAVVWLGRDDNQPTGLTGSTGALLVWADLFRQIKTESIDLTPPSGIVLGYPNGGFFDFLSSCKKQPVLPFYEDRVPANYHVCR